MPKYLNLDTLVGEDWKVEVKGRVFDISNVPARKMTELMKLNQDINLEGLRGDSAKAYEVFETENSALIDVLGKDQNGEPATYDWMVENLTISQFMKLVEFISAAMSGDENFTAETEDAANPE